MRSRQQEQKKEIRDRKRVVLILVRGSFSWSLMALIYLLSPAGHSPDEFPSPAFTAKEAGGPEPAKAGITSIIHVEDRIVAVGSKQGPGKKENGPFFQREGLPFVPESFSPL